jgi:hypothetical protein
LDTYGEGCGIQGKEQEEHTIDIASFKLYIPHNTWKFHITPEVH